MQRGRRASVIADVTGRAAAVSFASPDRPSSPKRQQSASSLNYSRAPSIAKARLSAATAFATNRAALAALKKAPSLVEAGVQIEQLLWTEAAHREKAAVAAAAHAISKLACVRGLETAQLEAFVKNNAKPLEMRIGQVLTLEDAVLANNHVFILKGKVSCHLLLSETPYPSLDDRDGGQPLISEMAQEILERSEERKPPMSAAAREFPAGVEPTAWRPTAAGRPPPLGETAQRVLPAAPTPAE